MIGVIFTVFILPWIIYWLVNYDNDYWKKRNVPYIKPKPIVGNYLDAAILRKSSSDIYRGFYESPEFKDQPYGGIFIRNKAALVLRDPDIIKTILVKDFHHFSDRGIPVDEKKSPLQAHLFSLSGWRWRSLRTKLTPTFTSGKMKMMFELMVECAQEMMKKLESSANEKEMLEMREELANFTTDVIGSCAFGLEFNSVNDPNNKFRQVGKSIFEFSWRSYIIRLIRLFAPVLLKIVPSSVLTQEDSEYFQKVVKDIVKYREENDYKRNDFMQLLIDIKNRKQELSEKEIDEMQEKFVDDEGSKVYELSENVLAAQAFIFFLAGFETSSTTMGFALHELALNQEIQDKLALEIQRVLKEYNGKLTYEAIQDMKYLDNVVSESLRKFSPAANIMRRCTKAYVIEKTNLKIEKDTPVFVPIYGLHYDPKYYPDPEVFNPDRFNPEEKTKRHPFTYLPFGEGPRICIGMRFGPLQSKLGLAIILNKYKFEICEKSTHPAVLDPSGLVSSLKGGVWLRIMKR